MNRRYFPAIVDRSPSLRSTRLGTLQQGCSKRDRLEAEPVDLGPKVPGSQVPIDLGGDPRIVVAHDALHCGRIRSGHHQEAGRRVAEVVEAKRPDLRFGRIADQGTMTFSHVRTSECEATVGTFENALGTSNGPNHPFSVRVKGTFRTGT